MMYEMTGGVKCGGSSRVGSELGASAELFLGLREGEESSVLFPGVGE